ncbi:MAG: hypothetical protein WEA58_07205 [Balneolaceae bacterium]
MKYIFIFTVLLLLALVLVSPESLMAQPPAPMLPLSPDQAPIDGGLTLLAVAGGGYAIKKLRDKKK